MIKPLEQFICDSCGLVIANTEEGWVEWLDYYDSETGKKFNEGFRICHHSTKCQRHGNDNRCSDTHLEDFLGEYKWSNIFTLLDRGSREVPKFMGPEVSDFREFIEFMKRLTIPYYEEARLYFSEDEMDDHSEFDKLNPNKLKSIIEKYSN